MAFCTSCGKSVPEELKFCTSCGASVAGAAQPSPLQAASTPPSAAAVPAAPVSTAQSAPAYALSKSSPYSVIGTGGFFGTILLFSLPVVGWIACLICAFGGAKNLNRRNLARAYLIFFIIALVLSIGLYFALWAMGDWLATVFQNSFYEAGGGEFGNFMDYLADGMTRIPKI